MHRPRRTTLFKILTFLTLVILIPKVFCLPVNFSRPLDPLEYQFIQSKHYSMYHDRDAPVEALGLMNALEAGKPPIDSWLHISRDTPLDVIVSSKTTNASFANFLTDAIELQTGGEGGRDLAWHELTHSTMYRHFDGILGPSYSILNLPWMPAWWIEGLAEALSVSIGSAEQVAIERRFALTNSWPSYDRLHSLYGAGGFAREGYAISGSFVAYLLRTYDTNKLGRLLEDFYWNSQPFQWLRTMIPFHDFMPMDAALEDWTGKNGRELYEEYKRSARLTWLKRTPKREKDFLKTTSK